MRQRKNDHFAAMLIALVFAQSSCPQPGSQAGANKQTTRNHGPSMTQSKPTKPFFEQVAALAALHFFESTLIGKLVGLPLVYSASESNEHYQVFHSPADQTGLVFSAIEVRSPVQRFEGKKGIIIADIASTLCIKRADIDEHFGALELSPPDVPRPNVPRNALSYDRYKQPWGILRLGFSKQSECMVKVVFDGT